MEQNTWNHHLLSLKEVIEKLDIVGLSEKITLVDDNTWIDHETKAGGDIYDLVMYAKNLTFEESEKWLSGNFEFELPRSSDAYSLLELTDEKARDLLIRSSGGQNSLLINRLAKETKILSALRFDHSELHEELIAIHVESAVNKAKWKYEKSLELSLKHKGTYQEKVYAVEAVKNMNKINLVKGVAWRLSKNLNLRSPERVSFQQDFKVHDEFELVANRKMLIDLYKNTYGHDISVMDDKAIDALYQLNQSFDPSLKHLLNLDQEISVAHMALQRDCSKLTESVVDLQEQIEKIDTATQKGQLEAYNKTKALYHVKDSLRDVTVVLKSSVVVMQGLSVVASAEVVDFSYQEHTTQPQVEMSEPEL